MTRFTIRGTRGTVPTSGPDVLRYGGRTTCFSVETDDGWVLVDAGTGLSLVSRDLATRPSVSPMTMLFTHFHMDHVVGLPCFDPLYSKESRIVFMGDPRRTNSWKESLRIFTSKPYWPVGLGESEAAMEMRDLPIDRSDMDLYGVRVSWFAVPHPQQSIAYRMEMPGNTVVIATDMEYTTENVHSAFIDFCAGADYLICDSQYTPEEYRAYRGWGHSTWQTATHIARAADVGRLILTHHAPDRTDDAVDEIVKAASEHFPRTSGAVENMTLAACRT